MGARFFELHGEGAVNADEIKRLRIAGRFAVIGVAASGDHDLGHFDSRMEAQAFIKGLCDEVDTYDTGEKAEKKCIEELHHYMMENFNEFANFTFKELMSEVCLDKYSDRLCRRGLAQLITFGYIENDPSEDVCFIPTLPTNKALQKMVSKVFGKINKDTHWDRDYYIHTMQYVWGMPNYPKSWCESVFGCLVGAQYLDKVEGEENYRIILQPEHIEWDPDFDESVYDMTVFHDYFNHLREGVKKHE